MCMANPIQTIASNPLQIMNPLSGFGLLPNNPVTKFAEKTINSAATPITNPIKKATGLQINAAPLVSPATFGSGLQIPQG